MTTAIQTIASLNDARGLALADAGHYPEIVQGVLPLIGPNAPLELRRWGAEFLAEMFASPMLPLNEKEPLSVLVLELFRNLLELPGEDVAVVKNVIQAAASIYPVVFYYIILNPADSTSWQTMTAIKSNILRRMDSASPGVRICCIKFAQRVVQTQTPGAIADPRRGDKNDISLALVPKDHALIPPAHLEAEASGLLDRLLGLLQENNSEALLVTATLNSLGSLIRLRATVANKIVSTVLNFNPLKLANAPMTPKTRVMIRSMERTTRALLIHVVKKTPNHSLTGRIHQYLERLHQSRSEIFDDSKRKRPAPTEATDALETAKRLRIGAESASTLDIAALPLPPGPLSYAQLYTLTRDKGSTSFDVRTIPIDLVVRLLPPLMSTIDPSKLDSAIHAVRARYLALQTRPKQHSLPVDVQILGGVDDDDDDDDYEPDYQPTEDADQIRNKLEAEPPDNTAAFRPPDVTLGPFTLPQPPALTEADVVEYGQDTVHRVLSVMGSLDKSSSKASKAGFNRLAASNFDRDAWVTVISRIATRSLAGLEVDHTNVKHENSNGNATTRNLKFSMSDHIRQSLFAYIMEDFRRRIDVAISWLSEEWFNDKVQQKASPSYINSNYEKWVLRLLDQMKIFLEGKDRVLIRFVSEIPDINDAMLERVKELARDPERVSLAVNAIHYLVLLRPPVREICLDALEDLWRNYDDARASTAKLLQKWRPHVLQELLNGAIEG